MVDFIIPYEPMLETLEGQECEFCGCATFQYVPPTPDEYDCYECSQCGKDYFNLQGQEPLSTRFDTENPD